MKATDMMPDRGEEFLNRRLEAFIRDFRPQDDRDAIAFDVRLTELIRNAYSEAVKPYERTMQRIVENAAIVTNFPAGSSIIPNFTQPKKV